MKYFYSFEIKDKKKQSTSFAHKNEVRSPSYILRRKLYVHFYVDKSCANVACASSLRNFSIDNFPHLKFSLNKFQDYSSTQPFAYHVFFQ